MPVDEEMEITSFDQIITLTDEYYNACITAGMGDTMSYAMALEFHKILLTDFMRANRVDD